MSSALEHLERALQQTELSDGAHNRAPAVVGQVPSQLDSRPESGPGEDYAHEGARDKRRSVTLRVFVTYSGAGSVDDMQLSIHVPPPLAASDTLFTIPSLRGSARTPVIVAVTLYAGSACLPPSNLVRATSKVVEAAAPLFL